MFQYARNVKIKGSNFTVNEHNGMAGALYGSVVNRYLQRFMQRSPDVALMGLGRRRP